MSYPEALYRGQRIRRHLFEERGLPRPQATVRGYWKHGRAGDAGQGT
jgi:NADPH-dependent ferric siderophore reductase